MKSTLTKINDTWYIDTVCFLRYLQDRVSLLTERLAVPGVDLPTTEALRGRRSEITILIQQLLDNTNGN